MKLGRETILVLVQDFIILKSISVTSKVPSGVLTTSNATEQCFYETLRMQLIHVHPNAFTLFQMLLTCQETHQSGSKCREGEDCKKAHMDVNNNKVSHFSKNRLCKYF